jgi:hypothetical protein
MRGSTVIVLAALAIGALGCDDVSKRYATLQDAKADEFFSKGWLPDVLPPSSRDFRVANNLDLNVSFGEFHFDPADFRLLVSKLHPYAKSPCPFVNFDDKVKHSIEDGYPVYEFTQDDSKWVFFCKPDRGACEYTMWVNRS